MDPELFTLLCQYCSLLPARELVLPENIAPEELQTFLVSSLLSNPLLQAYPPSIQYQQSFWKVCIAFLEGKDVEIDSSILEYYVSILPSHLPQTGSSSASVRNNICGRGIPLQPNAPSQSFITHFWMVPSDARVSKTPAIQLSDYKTSTLMESRTTIESGTTGMRTWQASLVLAQYIIDHPDLVRDKRVLELGAGIGFLGTVVASLQNTQRPHHLSSLWLTDVNEDVLARCRSNVSLPCNISSSYPNVHYRIIDWNTSLEPHPVVCNLLEEINPELILGADIIFDPALIPALVATLKLVLESPDSPPALFALTVRNESTFDKFIDSVQAQAMHVRFVKPSPTTWFVNTGIDIQNPVRIMYIKQDNL